MRYTIGSAALLLVLALAAVGCNRSAEDKGQAPNASGKGTAELQREAERQKKLDDEEERLEKLEEEEMRRERHQ